jgi:hypothetical protein
MLKFEVNERLNWRDLYKYEFLKDEPTPKIEMEEKYLANLNLQK